MDSDSPIIETDASAGFCFGVARAIALAEKELSLGGEVYCLGDMVHNESESQRLNQLGLKTIQIDDLSDISGKTLLFRAHGEPPSSYDLANTHRIRLIDGTCPVVLKLQQKIRVANRQGHFILIYGKKGHPEVVGLAAQTKDRVLVVEDVADLDMNELPKELWLFSQTTASADGFDRVKNRLENAGINVRASKSICKRVSDRIPLLKQFAGRNDTIVFAGGHQSSNARELYSCCLKVQVRSYFVSSVDEIRPDWFSDSRLIGITGATSAPKWLLEDIRERVSVIIRDRLWE